MKWVGTVVLLWSPKPSIASFKQLGNVAAVDVAAVSVIAAVVAAFAVVVNAHILCKKTTFLIKDQDIFWFYIKEIIV